jgi:hypothetical protein
MDSLHYITTIARVLAGSAESLQFPAHTTLTNDVCSISGVQEVDARWNDDRELVDLIITVIITVWVG